MATIGILLFDGAEELDFVGPFEVFTMSNQVFEHREEPAPDRVLLIAERPGLVSCAKGMRVEADATFADDPEIDILLIPGGQGTRREAEGGPLLDWVRKVAPGCDWLTSVCTGSLLLGAAGLVSGKRVTTHWAFVETLRQRGEAGEVLDDVRYVRDGTMVTAAGVSAGIDMALWLTGERFGREHARATQRAMEYDPAPPYQAAA